MPFYLNSILNPTQFKFSSGETEIKKFSWELKLFCILDTVHTLHHTWSRFQQVHSGTSVGPTIEYYNTLIMMCINIKNYHARVNKNSI